MQKIIDEVLKAEKNSEKIIQEARKSAAELKNRIESENKQRITMAHEEVHKLIQDAVIKAKKDAEEKYRLAMKHGEEKNADFMNNNKKNIDITINKIVNLIITPEYIRK